MKIVIVGAGKTGAFLGAQLIEDNEVTLIEVRPARVERVRAMLSSARVVEGDACEPAILEKAGVAGADLLIAATGDDELVPIRSFEELRWVVTQGALDGERVRLELQNTPSSSPREVVMDLSVLDVRDADAQLFRKIGVIAPWTRPSIGEVMPGGAAERAPSWQLSVPALALQAPGP